MSLACSIRLVMPEGPSDLSRSNFLIPCLSFSGVNRVMNRGCVVVVVVEACFFILGRSLATSHFSKRRVRVGGGKGDGPGRIESSAS